MRRLGIGYRNELKAWIDKRPEWIGNLEITAEHFFDGGEQTLEALAKDYRLFVHGLGLSLGTPGAMCAATLKQFARVADAANAEWVSEHVSFSRTAEVDLGHLNPLPRTQSSLDTMVEHALELSEYCGRPVVLENITASLDAGGKMKETEFLNQLCERADCGLLLDVTNLFINSKNHSYDPRQWVTEIQPSRITQLHVVGYSCQGARYHDHHSNPIQDDLMQLIEFVLSYAPVKAVTLERDERLEAISEIENELRRLTELIDKSANSPSA